MTIKQQAEAIVKKHYDIIANTRMVNFNSKSLERSAVKCAIKEVEALIDLLENHLHKPEYTTFIIKWPEEKEKAETMNGYELEDYYQQILTHLQTM